jgi:hypothetical protein
MPNATGPLEELAQRLARQQADLDALRQEFETRQAHLTDLKHRREELQGQLHRLEAEIQLVDRGETGSRYSSPARATQSQGEPGPPIKADRPQTLVGLLVEMVGQAEGPLTVKQLAGEVVRRNFPTASQNIPRLVMTRVQELVGKGIFRRAKDQPGVVLAKRSMTKQSPAARIRAAKPGRKTRLAAPEATPPTGSEARKRPLRAVLTELLAKSKRPVAARELADLVKSQGYQTQSKDFTEVVWVMLGKMDNVANVPGKGYRLK